MYDSDDILPNYLEADQLAAETSRPVPAAQLSRQMVVGLWALRAFVLLGGALVIYVFAASLH